MSSQLLNPFLKQVAHKLLADFGADLSRLTMVFPNKRARLFFEKYLFEECKIVFAPEYSDINALFEQSDCLMIENAISLNFELYKIFREKTQSSESFDEFYSFGEVLLNDFNDVDKNLVDAEQLFSNLEDFNKIRENFDVDLSEEQQEQLSRFFDFKDTKLQQNFQQLWNVLGEIYTSFKQNLSEKQTAYSGMMMRQVVENWDIYKEKYNQEKYVFVGFNVLTKCEKLLMKNLKKEGKALFFWDYDTYYYNKEKVSEAGRFIDENIKLFGQDIALQTTNYFGNQSIKILKSATSEGQSAYLPTCLSGFEISDANTAIVLCKETLLPGVISNLDSNSKYNITMGFPMTHTLIYSLLQSILQMQMYGGKNGYFVKEYVAPILSHSYVKTYFAELGQDDLSFIFSLPDDLYAYLLDIIDHLVVKMSDFQLETDEQELDKESIYRMRNAIVRLKRVFDTIEKDFLENDLLLKTALFYKVVRTLQVPFHSEETQGIQVMGLLETRNMDFENLILLNLNEGVFPKKEVAPSFIPQFVRKAYGMTTIEHQDSLYAYYFYRLLQRAKNITLMYSSGKELISNSEASRFIHQLLAEYPSEKIEHQAISFDKTISSVSLIGDVQKTDEMIDYLEKKYQEKSLSPSAINKYLNCGREFYFHYVVGLRSESDDSEDMDNAKLGSILHKAAEILYQSQPRITKDFLNSYLNDESKLKQIVEHAFNEIYFAKKTPEIKYDDFDGEVQLHFRTILEWLKRIVKWDYEKNCPFTILGLEKEVRDDFKLSSGKEISLGGIIDRLHEKDGEIFVCDYKTGKRKDYKDKKNLSALESLFVADTNRNYHAFQAFLYSMLQKRTYEKVFPAMIHPIAMITSDYEMEFRKDDRLEYDDLKVEDSSGQTKSFEDFLREKLDELFDKNNSFRKYEKTDCRYCEFKQLCQDGIGIKD